MTRLISAAVVALAVLASVANAKAQSDNSVVSEMARNMAACTNWAEIDCMNICKTAYRSFSANAAGDQASIAECRASYGPAKTRGEAKTKAVADEQAARKEAQHLTTQCRGENRAACISVCRKAWQDPGDSAALERCRALANTRAGRDRVGKRRELVVPRLERLAISPALKDQQRINAIGNLSRERLTLRVRAGRTKQHRDQTNKHTSGSSDHD